MESITLGHKHTYQDAFNQPDNDSLLPATNKKIKVETLNDKVTFDQQPCADSIIKLTLKDRCISQFKQGKAIAKMLSGYTRQPHWSNGIIIKLDSRLDKELSELMELDKSGTDLKVASTTLLVPQKPQELYRNFGFILDADKCTLREFYTEDAFTERENDCGELVRWCSNLKQYITKDDSKPTEFSGKFKTYANTKPVNDITDLLTHTSISRRYPGYIKINEVILDYNKTSVIGLIGTKGPTSLNYMMPSIWNLKLEQDTFESDWLTLKTKVTEAIGVDLPLFLYNDKTGDISFLQD
ncbi:MAG: hypothetical protein OXD32_07680 [Endozoicomonadaceae bacterium]|nr:hypothetical protein [Endozoicomonadaceae bacterium]MCY4330463.1 hypothetical protein [Endozoicomonadaceae bacterium]